MKKILLGIIIGIIMFFFFLYYGGADYVSLIGRKTEAIGHQLKTYEKGVRESAEQMKRIAREAREKIKKKEP